MLRDLKAGWGVGGSSDLKEVWEMIVKQRHDGPHQNFTETSLYFPYSGTL